MDRQNCRAIMAKLLVSDEDAFAELLTQKTGQVHQQERSHANAELQKALCRMEDVTRLYERLYEDNVSGKVTDEWFLQLSHKYEVESMDLKSKTARLRQQLAEADSNGLTAFRTCGENHRPRNGRDRQKPHPTN